MATAEKEKDALPQDEEMASDNASGEGSGDSDSESENEEIKESKIKELFEKITENPYHYASHLELITLLRKGGELEQLRIAREQMCRLFPLTAELWMEWLTDESIVSSQNEGRNPELVQLFEKATRDYLSVSVWLEYVQFSIGHYSSEPQKIREIFERALTAAGLHVTDGAMIWEAYREFELATLATLQALAKEGEESKDVAQQKNKILNLFKRQLSVPLLDMDKTYEEYREWTEGEIDQNVKHVFQKSMKKLEALKPYETSLISTEAPHLNEYIAYVNYEVAQGEPARIQCIYERALVENCLIPDLWQQYTTYLNTQLKIGEISLPVHERAVRNCPWSLPLWLDYIQSAERYQMEREKIKGIVDAAFQSGLTTADDYRSLWLTFLHYLRRSIKWSEDHEKELEQLRTGFQKAIDHLIKSFSTEGDPTCIILKYWAKVEAKFCNNVTKAREIWNAILHSGDRKLDAETWMEYANMERIFGDDKRYRKALLKGLMTVNDWPEIIGDALITFEKEEGTLETLDFATEKYSSVMGRIIEKRRKAEVIQEQNLQSTSPKRRKDFKRKVSEENTIDSDGFKIPRAKEPIMAFDLNSSTTEEPQKKKLKTTKEKPKLVKKTSENKEESDQTSEQKTNKRGATIPHDPSKDRLTVFVSNLDYSVEEDVIKENFSPVGEVEEIRLVRNYKGNSKGYCYVVFKTEEAVQLALKKDREAIKGRPMFVSPCKDKKQKTDDEASQKFKFHTGLEKNKLFIRGLPFTTTQVELEELYKQYGQLKEVRLVTYRNGHSKGMAYVEFNEENDATKALLKTDGLEIGSQKILVAYSNPPARKPKAGEASFEQQQHSRIPPLPPAGRGRGRPLMLMVPRSLQRPNPGEAVNGVASSSSSNGTNKKMSNADFRKLINK